MKTIIYFMGSEALYRLAVIQPLHARSLDNIYEMPYTECLIITNNIVEDSLLE
jgi:hypothetical protein